MGMSPEATITLEAGKTYYMAVRGVDKQGVPGELSEEVTAIIGGPDAVPPVISGVSVVNITSSSAVVSFSTNEEAYVQVEYGTELPAGKSHRLDHRVQQEPCCDPHKPFRRDHL